MLTEGANLWWMKLISPKERNSKMRRKMTALLAVIALLIAGCAKKEETASVYDKESAEYAFFSALADSIPELTPEKKVALVGSDAFEVTNHDIMPFLYRAVQGNLEQMMSVPMQEVRNFLQEIAIQEGERKLLMGAAEAKGITLSDDELEGEMEEIFESYGGREAFLQMVAQQGFDEDFVREDVRKSLIVERYLDENIFSYVEIPEDELDAMLGEDATATVRHILLLTQGKSAVEKEAIRKKMEGILDEARSGADFGELAKKYSEDPGSSENGGLYEKFPKGRMVKPFEDASFELPIGSISDVVETSYGYHIIKIEDRQKEERDREELKKDLQNERSKEQNMLQYQEHLLELKDKYHFKVNI
jgi:foldase protein PrsA